MEVSKHFWIVLRAYDQNVEVEFGYECASMLVEDYGSEMMLENSHLLLQKMSLVAITQRGVTTNYLNTVLQIKYLELQWIQLILK